MTVLIIPTLLFFGLRMYHKSMQNRTPLDKKYRAVKLLSASQRMWGNRFVPCFREISRELEMTPQNLTTFWQNRDENVAEQNGILFYYYSEDEEPAIPVLKKRSLSKPENLFSRFGRIIIRQFETDSKEVKE